MIEHKFIARPDQLLADHLRGVGKKARHFASKIGLADCGELIGLLHDIGKYSKEFQDYLYSAIGKLDPDTDDDYVNHKDKKGKIDHSTAGAQWLWRELRKYGGKGQGELCGQILALCIVSHHSGLIDCVKPDEIGEKAFKFKERMRKTENKTHLPECFEKIDCDNLLEQIGKFEPKFLIATMMKKIVAITMAKQCGLQIENRIGAFYHGLLTKFLFSCLIDADRIDSANPNEKYEIPIVQWDIAIKRFEQGLEKLSIKNSIDYIRRKISDECYSNALREQGIYTLTVPTGGGKTYSSLRYALHHAKKHKLDHIIYIIPYTSIIEQNAEAIRKLIEHDEDEQPWVLEHHSNLEPEVQTWHSKLAAENWNSPIIVTTMVQFLEVLFGSGTRGVRRLHQLANSVLIFDEIQTLPIKCVHLFCNSLNFLVNHAKTTAVLCTATQPLLNELRLSEYGQLDIPENNTLIANVDQSFKDLQRVDIVDKCNFKSGGWKTQEICDLILSEFNAKKSCLVIVNTKNWAQKLYQYCKEQKITAEEIFHLSTNQCPAHRKKLFDKIKKRLNERLPVLCISTQLIEAGVDIDFAVVIRFLAGLDSIAQAAGRCNRNGELKDEFGNLINGVVYVVNPEDEKIDSLPDIKVGKDVTARIFQEQQSGSLLSPEKIKQYFRYYFLPKDKIGYSTSLFDLLSTNSQNSLIGNCEGKVPLLQQSFMTAGKLFEAIDAPTQAVIVPYGEGENLIAELCRVAKEYNSKRYYELLKKTQRYSVNIFPNVWQKLKEEKAIYEIQNEGIYYLDERYYSEDFGLSTEPVVFMSCNIAKGLK
jgi:CRISPR-associated endonuclease/helicase Cas3